MRLFDVVKGYVAVTTVTTALGGLFDIIDQGKRNDREQHRRSYQKKMVIDDATRLLDDCNELELDFPCSSEVEIKQRRDAALETIDNAPWPATNDIWLLAIYGSFPMTYIPLLMWDTMHQYMNNNTSFPAGNVKKVETAAGKILNRTHHHLIQNMHFEKPAPVVLKNHTERAMLMIELIRSGKSVQPVKMVFDRLFSLGYEIVIQKGHEEIKFENLECQDGIKMNQFINVANQFGYSVMVRKDDETLPLHDEMDATEERITCSM